MNMVSLLALPLILKYAAFYRMPGYQPGFQWIGAVVVVVSFLAILWAVLQSKREMPALQDNVEEPAAAPQEEEAVLVGK